MQYRMLAPVALMLLVTDPVDAQGFGYAPGDARYQATVVTTMSRELGGQRMEDEVTQRQQFTVSLKSVGRDTLRIGLTLDSASVVSRTEGPQDVSQIVGLSVEGHLSPVGEVYSSRLTRGDLGPASGMIAAELARFLPIVRNDLRAGMAWTDTTTENVEMLGVPIRRRVVTTSTVAGDTMVAGQPTWRIDRTSRVSFAGEGSIQGQALTLEGSSTTDGRIFLTRAGRFLGSTQTDSSTTKVSSGDVSFSVNQTQRANVALR